MNEWQMMCFYYSVIKLCVFVSLLFFCFSLINELFRFKNILMATKKSNTENWRWARINRYVWEKWVYVLWGNLKRLESVCDEICMILISEHLFTFLDITDMRFACWFNINDNFFQHRCSFSHSTTKHLLEFNKKLLNIWLTEIFASRRYFCKWSNNVLHVITRVRIMRQYLSQTICGYGWWKVNTVSNQARSEKLYFLYNFKTVNIFDLN